MEHEFFIYFFHVLKWIKFIYHLKLVGLKFGINYSRSKIYDCFIVSVVSYDLRLNNFIIGKELKLIWESK